jgi:hypoxanthine phosphoribosyltransferase
VGVEVADNYDIEVLLSEEQISKRVGEIAAEISADFAGEEVMLVGILKGAVIFMADICRKMTVPVELDFMAVSSYGSATVSSGAVQIIKDIEVSIEGKNIIVVEDIVDSGLTLKYLLENLWSRGPASVKTCVLLDKPEARKVDVKIDYMGFEIPNKFAVGYGLDYAQKLRNLPYVGVLTFQD